jgi:hypothetical protein
MIQLLLTFTTPVSYTAQELTAVINGRGPRRWQAKTVRVSQMLKMAAGSRRLTVDRKIIVNKLIVTYSGPESVFEEIMKRA